MAEHDTLERKARKFLFDLHNFNEGAEQEEEVLPEEPPPPPPPPTFSLEELEAARAEYFARGQKDGLAQAAAAREKLIADQLAQIETSFKILFAAEQEREAAYEAESVALAQAIFRKIFPALNERHGLSEITDVIKNVLESQRDQSEIIIEVMPEYEEEIASLLQKLTQNLHMTGKFSVKSNPSLGHGDCRLAWRDGGAGRSASELSAEIGRIIQEALADRPILHDNKEEIKAGAADENISADDTPAHDTPAHDTPAGDA